MKNSINKYLDSAFKMFAIEFLITLVLFIVYEYLGGKGHILICFNYLICAAVIISYMYSLIIRIYERNDNKSNLNLLVINCCMLLLLSLAGILIYILNLDFSLYLLLYSVQNVFAFLQIGIIFKFRKTIKKYKNIFLIYYIQILSLLFIGDRHAYYSLYLIINIVFSYIVCFSIIKHFIELKDNIRGNLFGIVIFYMFSVALNYIDYLSIKSGQVYITFGAIVLQNIGRYLFYKKMIELVSKQYIEVASSMIKEVNEIIIKRNVILNEINAVIQKGKDKYNKLIDCIYDGVFLFHLEKLQYMNKGGLEFFQIENKEDIVGLNFDKFMKRYIKQEIVSQDKENSILKINSENENTEIFLIDVSEYTKILYIHDISELNENKKLREKLEEYLKVDEIKKEFFANISHELKTPINVIFSALQVNDFHIKDNNMSGINKNFKRIRQNCMRLIRTINNFIDANKISEGYVVPNLEVHNIVEIIEDTANMCNKYIELSENSLIFDSEEEEIYVLCDKEMIMTIILNILSNSVKYGIKGGWIKIYIECTSENNINIRIKNNGLKIDEKTAPYIFDKFTKLNKAFNRLKEGSGLGLFLTKGLVELQNGKIRLTSSKEGNQFIIELPRISEVKESIYETLDDQLQINKLEEKVDIEFSDIYIDK